MSTATTNHEDWPEPQPEVLSDGRVSLYDSESERSVVLDIGQIEALHAKLDEARALAARKDLTNGLRRLADWMDAHPDAYIGYTAEDTADVGPSYLREDEVNGWAERLGIDVHHDYTTSGYKRTDAWIEFGGGVRYGYTLVRKVEQDAEVRP